MKKPLLFAAFVLLINIYVAAQNPKKPGTLSLYFETDRSELPDNQRTVLLDFLKTLPGDPALYTVSITGHADPRGSETYNQDLSMRRGQEVSGLLAARGFSRKRIALVAEGERNPIAGIETDEGLKPNRRVDLLFESKQVGFDNRPSDLVPEMKARFQAERGITFVNPFSGSKVQIPAGILVYPDGQPVQGEVELDYREWRNLYDYLAFGLPMHFQDGRGDFFFNSNGMFEVQALQNGQPLGVARGKTFAVTFVQTKNMSDVNLYRFDQNSGLWNVVAAPGECKTPVQAPGAVTYQSVEAQNDGFGQPRCTPSPLRFSKDAQPADLLADAVQTGYDLATGARHFPPAFLEDPLQDDTALVRQSERTLIQLSRFADVKTYFFIDDLNRQFSELELIKGYKWEYVPSLVDGEFTDKHLSMKWEAAYLSYDKDNNLYDLQLANPALKIEIKVRLYHPDGRTVNRTENPLLFAEYKRIQKIRWDSKLEVYTSLRRFLSLSTPLREADEWCMGQVSWLKYFIANRQKMQTRYAQHLAADYHSNPDSGNALIQNYNRRCRAAGIAAMQTSPYAQTDMGKLSISLQLSDFGIYNCDQIYRLGAGTQVMAASFRTREGDPINPRITNVIEKNSQMMLSAPQPNQIFYSPEKTFDIVVVGDDGRTYLLRASDFAQLPLAGNSKADLVLEDVTDQVKTPKDWLTVLGI